MASPLTTVVFRRYGFVGLPAEGAAAATPRTARRVATRAKIMVRLEGILQQVEGRFKNVNYGK